MKRLLRLFACTLAAAVLTLQLSAADGTPKNRLVYPFAFAPSEGLVNRTESPWREDVCLNGYWDFQPVALPESYRQGKGEAPELPMPQASGWSDVKIKIPSPWNINGYSWRNLEGPDHRNYPSYPKEWDSAKMGWMRKTATIPAGWDGKVIKLYFEAVAGFAEIYVNDKKVCENFDLFLPFSVDITDIVKPGETAEILVGVRSQALFENNSTIGRRIVPAGSMWGSYINGIWQDVYLVALPQVHVEDVYVKPLVSKKTIEMDVTVRNCGAKAAALTIGGDIHEWLNLAGCDVNSAPVPNWALGAKALSVPATKIEVPAGDVVTTTITIPVADGALKFWTPESPNLYSLLLSIKSKKTVIDTKYTRFGWREWTLEGTKQCLNGKPYELHGDSWHFMGVPQMTRRYAWAWFTAIKGMNGNAVRPHAQIYPQFYLDVADEMGICVLDETANWGSDGGPKFDAPEFWENSKDHLRRFVLRDRNHASIFGWSISNENKPVIMNVFNRPDLMPLQEQAWKDWRDIVKANDTTRPWISSDGEDDGNGILPVTVGHYGDEGSMRHWIGIGKPWGIGEHGMAYYGTPEQVSKYNGERAYESQLGRMEGLANEAYGLISAQRANGASYSTVFNMVWYALRPMPFGKKDLTTAPDIETDGIFFENYKEGVPGIQPERIGPYCSTLNPGYDPSLPLYDPWPLYEAMRAVNAPGGPAWSPYAEVDKSKYAALPAEPAEPYKEVVYAGDPASKAKAVLDMQGVIFAPKVTKPESALYIIDGSKPLDAAAKAAIEKDAAKGADIWIWGLSPEAVGCLGTLLPREIALDQLKRSSYLPVQLSWTRGLNNSDFYFCEVQRSDASEYSLKGSFVDNSTVLLNACRTDWRTWNKRAEDSKTASVIRSENECTAALPVLVKYANGLSDIYVSTLTNFANSEKGFNTLSTLLRNAGISCAEREVNPNEMFFLRDGEIRFPFGTSAHAQKTGEHSAALDVHVYSSRPLDDLLIEPNMPKLTLIVNSGEAALAINGKDFKPARTGRREAIFHELPLQQGWNKLTISYPSRQGRFPGASFRCDNNREYMQTMKVAFNNPEK